MPAGIFVHGIVVGALAGLNSIGLVLLWRTTRIVNLAQPPLGLIGGVLTGLLVTASHWSFWWAVPVGLLVGAVFGLVTDRVILRKLRDAPRSVVLVATVGLAGLFAGIQTALPFAFTGQALPTYQVNIGFSVFIHPYRLTGAAILAVITFPLAVVGVLLFLYRTRFGLAALALGQDAERAQSLGVSASAVRSVVWVIAGILATISGILYIPNGGSNLEGNLGPTVLLLALAPAVFARFRSILGTALASLALGVGYEMAYFKIARSGVGELVFAGALLLVVAFQRRRGGREESAARASSWAAAATVRPLAWAVRRSARFRAGTFAFTAVVFAVAVVMPAWLTPAHRVAYAGGAALALAALAVSAAWMFTGEIALGHWGLAGFGAAIASVTPGAWPLRAVVAGLAMAAAGGALGLVSRRQTTLSFAVLGLAAAAAAPVVLLFVPSGTVPASPGVVGAATAGVVVLGGAAITRLRGTVAGSRMIAARDDPQRAVWLGADPMRQRILGLAVSGGLAGMAGAFILASTAGSLAPGQFDPQRSLDLLMMAVIGGLGSPAGAILGAALITIGQHVLPNAWQLLVSGTGVLFVVIFRPAGLSRLTTWARDVAARALARPGPAATGDEKAVA